MTLSYENHLLSIRKMTFFMKSDLLLKNDCRRKMTGPRPSVKIYFSSENDNLQKTEFLRSKNPTHPYFPLLILLLPEPMHVQMPHQIPPN